SASGAATAAVCTAGVVPSPRHPGSPTPSSSSTHGLTRSPRPCPRDARCALLFFTTPISAPRRTLDQTGGLVLRVVDLHPVLAAALGEVERRVGGLDQRLGLGLDQHAKIGHAHRDGDLE